MRELTREFIKFFISLKLTVALLALSALLIFLATIDQVHLGIWAVQEKWFKSLVVLQDIRGIPFPVFPGGYAIGGLLLINLIAAHLKRFAFKWKKAGIQLVHGGLILMLLGELFTGIFQEEYQLRLDEGQTKNYSESWRHNELAIIDTTAPTENIVTVIPERKLERAGTDIQTAALPFRVVVRDYYPNANLAMREPNAAGNEASPNLATVGLGPRVNVMPLPVTYRQDQRNQPAVFIELIGPEGSLGTYLLSTMLVAPERFSYANREWAINLRLKRAYKPYSLTLLQFSHDRYAGTEIPKNFSSRIRLKSQDGIEDREALIFMNNPLRYDGMTFYQAGFDNNDRTTVLQVVRNPSWLIPYVSCLLMAIGLFWQFGWHLVSYSASRGKAPGATSAAPPDRSIALGLVLSLRLMAGFVALWAASSGEGQTALIALALVVTEFVVCATLLGGLIAGRSWTHSFHRAYAWAALLLLVVFTAYGFLGGDIYDAILRWLVIGVHALTTTALFALLRRPAVRIAS